MYSLKKQKGFTIVELLIVIVVIGILATLVIVTFTGIQKKGRDSQRQTDIGAVASHISAYYADKGTYPSLANLQDASFVSGNLKGLDPQALIDPKGGAIAATATTTAYGYTATQDDGSACDSSDTSTTPCTKYTLTAKLEKDGSSYTKSGN